MDPRRRRAAVFAVPMVIVFVAAQRVGHAMRTVDFLTVFAAGMIFGITLAGVIRSLRDPAR